MSITSKAYKSLFNGLLLLVYSAFFLVQFIYNFDVSNSVCNKRASSIHAQHSVVQTIFHAHKNCPAKQSIRLNKRFSPAEALVCDVFTAKAPISYIEKKSLSYYYNETLLSSIQLHRSLRAPPVVA
jgi:hypothetical protein